jgi:hypothetical protein
MPITERVTNALGGRTRAHLSSLAMDVQLDVVLNFSSNNAIEVTQHAIQDGADITDNIDPKTEDYTIDAILTDDDYDILDPTSLTNPTIKERLDYLEVFIKYKYVLTYYGQDGDIEDVIISSMSKSKTQETGRGVRLSIGLKKINVAVAQSVEAPTVTKQNSVNQKGQNPKGTNSKMGDAVPKKRVALLKQIVP